MLRWLTGFLLVSLLLAGAAFWFAGRGRPPVITIERPERVVGQTGTLDVVVEAPGGRFTSLTVALEQNGRTIPLFNLEGDVQSAADGLQKVPRERDHADRAGYRPRLAPVGEAERAGAPAGRRAYRGRRIETLVPEPAHPVEHGCEGLPGPARPAAPCGRLDASLCEPRRRGDDRVPRDASRRRIGGPRRRSRVSGLSAARRRSLAEGRVLRPASRAGSQDADRRLRAGRSRQPGDGQLRGRRVPEADEEEPHHDRRWLHQPHRPRHHRALTGAENGGTERRSARRLPEGQRRAPPDQRRPDCGVREADRPGETVERPVRPAWQLAGRGGLCGPPDLPLSGQRESTSRCTWGSTLR